MGKHLNAVVMAQTLDSELKPRIKISGNRIRRKQIQPAIVFDLFLIGAIEKPFRFPLQGRGTVFLRKNGLPGGGEVDFQLRRTQRQQQ
ncbi:hypothetical protein SDC9_196734 [bioreactor metagenome]|uniref:Uncharacterized protein n=1 Tax=bioreactor metagenome TaxID=1076179 RepID=A0A645ICP4_9ZZZZ